MVRASREVFGESGFSREELSGAAPNFGRKRITNLDKKGRGVLGGGTLLPEVSIFNIQRMKKYWKVV